jgi:SAM-dependent methyltransferase
MSSEDILLSEPDNSDIPAVKPAFKRAVLDRNMTVNPEPVRAALADIDLTGLAILDFGCGNGNLLRLLKNTNAAVVYAFEIVPDGIDADIRAWANDPDARPKLVINPPEFKIDPAAADGDLTNYNYFALLAKHDKFGIVSNPPYFLYNRILSLTGENLAPGDEKFAAFRGKFAGALMITSKGRLHNHPGWEIKTIMRPDDFDPPAGNDQYLVQTGFNKAFNEAAAIRTAQPPQKYVSINNRAADADETDAYPEMWEQVNALRLSTPSSSP